MPNCIVCNTPNAKVQAGTGDFSRFDCERCGSFALSYSAQSSLESQFAEKQIRRSLMSFTLRKMQLPDGKHVRIIKSEELPSFWREDRLPTPLQQADNFILWVGKNQETPASWARATPSVIAATIGIAISADGSGDSQGWGWLHAQLEPKELYRLHPAAENGKVGIMLTLAGWERYELLSKQQVDSRTAFMAMKFGDTILDQTLNECFRPAVVRAGFELRVLSDQQAAGLIDDQIRSGLLSARFVIADLTHGSYGAYWEAGYAEGRGIPVIYTCEKSVWESQKTHFDTNHLVTIVWDPAEPKKTENALTATIRATLRGEAKQIDD